MKRSQRWEPRKPAAPVIKTRSLLICVLLFWLFFIRWVSRRAPDALIVESQFPDSCYIEKVAAVKYDFILQRSNDLQKVRSAKLVPFRRNDQRIGAFQGLVLTLCIDDLVPDKVPHIV